MNERPSDGRTAAAIGERLALTRQALGLSQREFSERAHIAANTYNQYERGTNIPALDKAHQLCDGLGLTLDWIFRGDPSGLRYDLAEAIKSLRTVRR